MNFADFVYRCSGGVYVWMFSDEAIVLGSDEIFLGTLSRLALRNVYIGGMVQTNVDLEGSDLSGGAIIGSTFVHANLSGSNLIPILRMSDRRRPSRDVRWT